MKIKLVDLEPRWLLIDGKRVGFVFRSPTMREWFQSCFLVYTPHRVQMELAQKAFGEDCRHVVQLCKEGVVWACTPPIDEATFENISVTPSIDGSPGGTWHGHITNGQIVGGI